MFKINAFLQENTLPWYTLPVNAIIVIRELGLGWFSSSCCWYVEHTVGVQAAVDENAHTWP